MLTLNCFFQGNYVNLFKIILLHEWWVITGDDLQLRPPFKFFLKVRVGLDSGLPPPINTCKEGS